MEEANEPGQAAMREALRRAAAALKDARVPWALAGSYALYAYGAPEPTHDVDLVVEPEAADAAARALSEAGFSVEQPVEDWLFKACWEQDGETALVDVIHRLAGRPVDRGLIDGADTRALLAIEMPVLAPEMTMWAKLEVLDEHSCDLTPLFPLARAVREQVDWPGLRQRVAGNPFASSFIDLLVRLRVVSA